MAKAKRGSEASSCGQEVGLGPGDDGTGTADPLDKESLTLEEQAWDRHAQAYVTDVLAVRYPTLLSEVAVGTAWENVALIVPIKDRKYPKVPGWMYGTADIVGLSEDQTELYVGDWKTGGSEGAEEQLLSLAACFYRALSGGLWGYPIKRVVIGCLSVTEEGMKPNEREVSLEELDAHFTAMGWQWEKVLAEEGKAIPGIHCTTLYCPHLSHCKEVNGLVLEASEGEKGLLAPEQLVRHHRMTDRPQSDEEAGYVMERVTAAKRQLNYYTEAMKDYSRSGGLILSGKYEWGPGPDGFRWRRRKISS